MFSWYETRHLGLIFAFPSSTKDLMQSVPITTDIVGSTPTQGEVYNIIW
jgi:hypothetical protein